MDQENFELEGMLAELDLLQKMAVFDDNRRIMYGLLVSIGEDLPVFDAYQDELNEQLSLTVQSFTEYCAELCSEKGSYAEVAALIMQDEEDRIRTLSELRPEANLQASEYAEIAESIKNIFASAEDNEGIIDGVGRVYTILMGHDVRVYLEAVQVEAQNLVEQQERDAYIVVPKRELRLAAASAAAGVLGGLVLRQFLRIRR